MDEAKYAKAFTNGYLLAKYQPELFHQVEKSLDPDHPMILGKQEFDKEKARDFFKNMPVNDKGIDKQKDIDKDK